MITRENLIEAANRLYENINIEFVDGDNPYWNIQSADPEEIDEDITVAKLYCETFDLEIKVGTLLKDGIIDLCMVFGENEDWIREREPEWLLRYVIDTIYDEISEYINYNDVLLEYLR